MNFTDRLLPTTWLDDTLRELQRTNPLLYDLVKDYQHVTDRLQLIESTLEDLLTEKPPAKELRARLKDLFEEII